MNAAKSVDNESDGADIFLSAIQYPYKKILDNAGMDEKDGLDVGHGINVVTGKTVHMIEEGIIDPLLVTKSALKNAVSVASTILSTDCVISNMREE